MLVPTPFVPRDSFIKADAQQIQLMYFPATYQPTTHLARNTIIHSVEKHIFLLKCTWYVSFMLFQSILQVSPYIENMIPTLESGIEVGQGINVRPGKFGKKNKRRALNKRRAS